MKKITLSLVTAMLMLIMVPAHATETTSPIASEMVSPDKVESAEIKAIIARIDEIKAMDKSALSSSERKALRKEMRLMKKTVNDHGHGGTIYISGGLIILIVVLIILL